MESVAPIRSDTDAVREKLRSSYMELTGSQKLLINGLDLFGVEMDEMLGIMLALKSEAQQWELMKWMADNQTATPSDIVGKTMDILRSKS